MKQYKRGITKQKNKGKITKKDKGAINFFWALSIFFLVHYTFFNVRTIGHDSRYVPYIVLLPILAGMIVVFILNFKSYRKDLVGLKNLWSKFIATMAYLLLFVLPWAYLGFAQFAGVAWNYINKKTAAENSKEIFYCNVEHFAFSKNCNIQFNFQNRREYLRVSYKDIEMYKEVSPNRYQIAIIAQKGIWNYYIIKDWSIVEKSDRLMEVTR